MRRPRPRLLKRLKPQEATEPEAASALLPPVEGAVQAQPTPPLAGRRVPAPRQATSPSPAGWTAPVYQAPQPKASLDDLQSVQAGTSRRDLVARLGTPSARVTIPEDGELREVYHFSSGQVHLGRVTLSNGSVANVEVDPAGPGRPSPKTSHRHGHRRAGRSKSKLASKLHVRIAGSRAGVLRVPSLCGREAAMPLTRPEAGSLSKWFRNNHPSYVADGAFHKPIIPSPHG